MPFWLFSKTTERSLVPKTPLALARASSSFRPGIGFISCTPSALSARPLSILRKGTTFFSSHRYWAASLPWNLPSSVASNRMAPSTRSPVKAGLETMRSRILWTRSIISLSLLYSLSSTPYSFRALGVLPPLWSSAAMKPLPLAMRLVCSVLDMTGCSPLEKATKHEMHFNRQSRRTPETPSGRASRRAGFFTMRQHMAGLWLALSPMMDLMSRGHENRPGKHHARPAGVRGRAWGPG